jgi:hypothetical protein
MFVYVIVCSETLKIYVGQHKKENLQKYLSQKFFDANRYSGKRSHLYAAMRRHPKETWSIHPLVSGIEDRKELDETEQLLIYALKAQHPDVGYNICDGGEGFTGPHSEETKRKIGLASKGNQNCLGMRQSPETIAKRRAKQIGQKRTPEQCQNISSARSGKGFGQCNAAGKRTGEALENIRQALAKQWTPERRQQQADRIRQLSLGRVPWNKKIAEPSSAAH